MRYSSTIKIGIFGRNFIYFIHLFINLCMLCTCLITSNVLPYLQPFDIEHHLDVMKEKKGSECD